MATFYEIHERMACGVARQVVRKKHLVAIVLLAITVFFGFQSLKTTIVSKMEDLLPSKHPFVQLHERFRNLFGGANVVVIQVKAKEGDIFQEQILWKIRRISDELVYFPGVDRYKIYSIGVRKLKNVVVTDWGLEFPPLMWPEVPKTPEENAELKRKIFTNEVYYGTFVSFDGKAALISAEFYEKGINYRELFKRFQKIRAEEEDDTAEINIVGDPIILGYIDHYLNQTFLIIGLTFLAMIVLIFMYTGSKTFTLLPLLSSVVSGIWGVGFAGMLGFNTDPLILVVPLLLTARALTHSIQFNERFVEEIEKGKNRDQAVEATMAALFYPGLAGIITDGIGILLISIIPIPLLVKLGMICFFWAVSVVFSVLFLNPVLLLYLHPKVKQDHKHARGIFDRILEKNVRIVSGKNAWVVVVTTAIVLGGFFYLQHTQPLEYGDAKPGTPLLWPKSRYNTDEVKINEYFPGVMNPLLVVVEGVENAEEPIKHPDTLQAMVDFQWFLATVPEVTASVAYPTLLKTIQMKFYEDYPKWAVIPDEQKKVGALAYLMTGGGAEPGDYDKYVNPEFTKSNVLVFCTDRVGATIDKVVEKCEKYIKDFETTGSAGAKLVDFKLAAGLLGLRYAVNHEVKGYQLTLATTVYVATAFFCMLSFWAFSPGLLLIIPLWLANFFCYRYMAAMDIGLNINTLPVAAIAVGIGVDYGLYFLGRVEEEIVTNENLELSVTQAIRTTGRAICFTGVAIIMAVVAWLFSSIRFQAEMGVLLAVVTVFQMIGTLVLLPALVLIVKPPFLLEHIKEKGCRIEKKLAQ